MADVHIEELAPGIHRIETVAGDGKLHGYHVMDGPGGPILVDSGYAGAPDEIYAPFLATRDERLEDVQAAIITHADADHFGANHELRAANPTITLLAHNADASWIESTDRIMDERYRGFSDHGIVYEDSVYDWLSTMMGRDERLDVQVQGGEVFCVNDRPVHLLHTPGHTPGHCVLWDPSHRVVIGGDAIFGQALSDVDGQPLQPPPYHLYRRGRARTPTLEVGGEARRKTTHAHYG